MQIRSVILVESGMTDRSFSDREKMMNHITHVDGFFVIDPPLRWLEIRDSPFLVGNWADSRDETDVILDVERKEIETDEGVSTVITCKTAVPLRSSYDCRNLYEETTVFVEAMTRIGRTVRGEMTVQPRDYGDGGIWRIVVDDTGVHKDVARHLWPDGTEVKLY